MMTTMEKPVKLRLIGREEKPAPTPDTVSVFGPLVNALTNAPSEEVKTHLLIQIANIYIEICARGLLYAHERTMAQNWIWTLLVEHKAHTNKGFAKNLSHQLNAAENHRASVGTVEIIGKIKCKPCVYALLKNLSPGSDPLCWFIVWALGELGSGIATLALMQMFWHKGITTRQQRHALANALVKIGDLRAVGIVAHLIEKDFYKVPAERTKNRQFFTLRPPLT